MPHPRTARPAPESEDDDDPRTDAELRAELQRRLDHLSRMRAEGARTRGDLT